jgi:hypothetical protein
VRKLYENISHQRANSRTDESSTSEHESLGCGTFDVMGKFSGNKIIGNFKMQGRPYEIVLTKE